MEKKDHGIRKIYDTTYLASCMGSRDWHSRSVFPWEISNAPPLDNAFCTRALEKALGLSSPEIFNSDQGSQLTSLEFTGLLEELGVAISMDGRGRAMDNIFVERLWRTLKTGPPPEAGDREAHPQHG